MIKKVHISKGKANDDILEANKITFPMIYYKRGPLEKVQIVYKNSILQDFDNLQFPLVLACLMAYYFVFSIPYAVNNEKSLGFYQEILEIKESVHYETVRNRNYISFLTELKE